MPKLTRNFLKGRMNKDLDERLVPKGEYRDAQNIQISTSEGSDVGAVENMLSNTKLVNAPGNQTWSNQFGLVSPVVIGAARDTQNNKIYWFITSSASDVDAILEYDEDNNEVAPVIVDTRDGSETGDPVLNFNVDYLITGINIIDGMLFWTDDLNEPRKINIETFKAGSAGNTTSLNATTQVYRPSTPPPNPVLQIRLFIEDDITVIRKAPDQALTVTAYPSIYSGAGTGITPVTLTHNFYNVAVGDVPNVAFDQNINWSGNASTDFIISGYIDNEDGSRDNYEIRGEIDTYTSASDIDILINSISEDIPNQAIDWELLLIEDDPIFKNDFPRFTYRYKFIDGEYSPYAPFSKVAFVPGEFEYLSRDGNNIGMESVIRKITLSNMPDRPSDVIEVELLYKGARSNNVYLIHSFDHDNTTTVQPAILPFDITSGTLGRVIDSAQLLRLYDNVPKKAKAQEIISNRVVYGNYLENYNINNSDIRITSSVSSSTHAAGNFGEESVKSDREYQIGITFIDDYGRESPVFTSGGGAVTINGDKSNNSNSLVASLSNFSIPTGISKFKYYVKDPSSEYYNIALDRYYEAADGGIWLSFPSAERNKLQEGQYITLKKQHDNNTPVTLNNKNKILAIENEAPDYLKKVPTAFAVGNCLTEVLGGLGFEVGDQRVRFWGPPRLPDTDETTAGNVNFYDGFKKGNLIQFSNKYGSGDSYIYEIKQGGPTGYVKDISNTQYALYEISFTQAFKQQDNWLANLSDEQDFRATIFRKEDRALPEFQGRFFVKIAPSANFKDNIKSAFSSTAASLETELTLLVDPDNTNLTDDQITVMWDDATAPASATYDPLLPQANSSFFRIFIADISGTSPYPSEEDDYITFFTTLANGNYIKFRYTSDTDISAKEYRIVNITQVTYQSTISGILGNMLTVQLDKNFSDSQYSGTPTAAQLTGIQLLREKELGTDQEFLSSTNPAIFETEPLELADLDLYYEATDAIALGTNNANLTTNQTLNFFNTYSFGNGVESNRIRDDFNAPVIGNGVRVSSTIEEPYREERRGSGMIFSGIINSRSGINESNQFLIAQDITKDLNPIHGTIQKLSARGAAARGDLIALCEDKVFKILANKDALFNADGNTNLTATKNVLGQAIPFAGEYGISTQPESFASFGFRSYFCDRKRRAVLRLSADGLTVISDKGLKDYFRDEWTAQVSNKIFGGYDEYTNTYHAKVQGEQVLFSETVNGWVTRTSWVPQYSGISLNNIYYTFKNGELYSHNGTSRNHMYGAQESSSITAVLNDMPAAIKNFKTLEYQGDAEWTAEIITDQEKGTSALTFIERENLYQNYIKGTDDTWDNNSGAGDIDFKSLSILGVGLLSEQTEITGGTDVFNYNIDVDNAISIGDRLFYQEGNTIKEIAVISDINLNTLPKTISVRNSILPAGTIINTSAFTFVSKNQTVNTSGLIGYYADVKFSTGNTNQRMELFGIGSEVFISSE